MNIRIGQWDINTLEYEVGEGWRATGYHRGKGRMLTIVAPLKDVSLSEFLDYCVEALTGGVADEA